MGPEYLSLEHQGFGNLAAFKTSEVSCEIRPDKLILNDLSEGKEPIPITVTNNCYNDYSFPPIMEYITKRTFSPLVNFNSDLKFLSCCDCSDNCLDKTKCSCWQLTCEGQKNSRPKKQNFTFYKNKRLNKCIPTGIFECNENCKCTKTCSNRVVQEPSTFPLQLFSTKKKGWGVKTLAFIPKGSFVCNLLGEITKETDVAAQVAEDDMHYLLDLDFIEVCSRVKSGYEQDVVDPEALCKESKENKKIDNNDNDEEFNLEPKLKKKKFQMELRKNRKQTKYFDYVIDAKKSRKKLTVRQKNETSSKTLRSYLGGNYVLSANVKGNIARYFNHSCDPNIFIQNVFVDSHDPRFPWVSYFALTNIPKGTELAMDYGYVVDSVKDFSLPCYCESNNCKRILI